MSAVRGKPDADPTWRPPLLLTLFGSHVVDARNSHYLSGAKFWLVSGDAIGR
jgi:hypothetical protein